MELRRLCRATSAGYNGGMDNPRVIRGDHSLLTMENKVDWFRRLTVEERFHVWQSMLEFVLAARPGLEKPDATDPSRRVRILRASRG